jgi:hypothetical protein
MKMAPVAKAINKSHDLFFLIFLIFIKARKTTRIKKIIKGSLIACADQRIKEGQKVTNTAATFAVGMLNKSLER